MTKLLSKIEQLGWFGGKFKVEIGIERTFEGYSGHATETWETQYSLKTEGLKSDSGEQVFPALNMKSKSYEKFEDFIKRVEEHL